MGKLKKAAYITSEGTGISLAASNIYTAISNPSFVKYMIRGLKPEGVNLPLTGPPQSSGHTYITNIVPLNAGDYISLILSTALIAGPIVYGVTKYAWNRHKYNKKE